MSLINQALKKEQSRRQTGQNEVAHPMVSRGYAARREGNKGALLLIGFAGMGLVMLGCVAAVVYFGKGYLEGLNDGPATVAKVELPAEVPAPAAEPAEPAAPVSPLDAITPEQLAALKALLAEQAAAETEAPTAPEAETAAPAFKSEFATFIAKLPVQGSRVAGPNSRLLLDGKVYKVGDVIDHGRGLRFREAQTGLLLFEDATGAVYERTH